MWVEITRTEKTSTEIFAKNMNFKSIWFFWKAGDNKIVLVWDNANYHIRSKVKEFYIKNEINIIK